MDHSENLYLSALDGPDRDRDSGIAVLILSAGSSDLRSALHSARLQAADPERVHPVTVLRTENMDIYDAAAALPGCSVRAEFRPGRETAGRGILRGLDAVTDERYVLICTDRSLFAPGWDASLIRELGECGENALLSEFPWIWDRDPAPDGARILARADARFAAPVRPAVFDPALHVFRPGCTNSFWVNAPLRGAFACFGTVFTRTRTLLRTLPDPELLDGEGAYIWSLRLWTAGTDVYHPRFRAVQSLRRSGPEPPPDRDAARRSAARLKTFRTSGRFGTGTERTERSFYGFAGIDPISGAVRTWAREGRFDLPRKEDEKEVLPS